jgi:hypothetical protein
MNPPPPKPKLPIDAYAKNYIIRWRNEIYHLSMHLKKHDESQEILSLKKSVDAVLVFSAE